MNKYSLRNAALLIGASVLVALAVYGISFWFLQLYAQAAAAHWGGSSLLYLAPPSEISALDGIFLILGGAGFLLGSGGISANSRSAAMRASVASAMGKETVGPSEMMRRDAWKPEGHIRLGLVLIIAGIVLIVLAFALV